MNYLEDKKLSSRKTRIVNTILGICLIAVVVIACIVYFNSPYVIGTGSVDTLTAHITYHHEWRHNETIELSSMIVFEGAPITIKFGNLDINYSYVFTNFSIPKDDEIFIITLMFKSGVNYNLYRVDNYPNVVPVLGVIFLE